MGFFSNIVMKSFFMALALTGYQFIFKTYTDALLESYGFTNDLVKYFSGLFMVLVPTYIIIAIATRKKGD